MSGDLPADQNLNGWELRTCYRLVPTDPKSDFRPRCFTSRRLAFAVMEQSRRSGIVCHIEQVNVMTDDSVTGYEVIDEEIEFEDNTEVLKEVLLNIRTKISPAESEVIDTIRREAGDTVAMDD